MCKKLQVLEMVKMKKTMEGLGQPTARNHISVQNKTKFIEATKKYESVKFIIKLSTCFSKLTLSYCNFDSCTIRFSCRNCNAKVSI